MLAILLPLALLVAAGCSATGRVAPGKKVLVGLRDYRSGSRLELANETHTDRVTYYSHERDDAARKVQTDEVVAALLAELDRHGFAAHAAPGPAPATARGDVIRWSLEVEIEGQPSHWLIGPGSQKDEWQAFQECRDVFVQLYNVTVSYQTVQNAAGGQFFEDTPPPPRGKAR